MGEAVYFTTPLYYVNAEPHIGHLYTTVLVDTLRRFHRMMGDDAYFLTGTDEHGEKIAQVAAGRGITPRALADEVSGVFRETWRKIGIENDDFIRTTEPRHVRFVQEILTRVKERGDIYFDEYKGLYCVGCERYLLENELVEGKCPDHQKAPEEVKEANYFFKMSRYQEPLVRFIDEHPDWIRPERFRNEVRSFLNAPLEDLCISRPKTRLTWGIPLPFDDRFVTYVWFDALLNYVSALKEAPGGADLSDRYWTRCNHVIAKDILKTHAIYWPTMLMAAGLPLFRRLDVHGYWLSGESKMSKSLGNVVRPQSFDAQFGIENLRYFFFREMKFGSDSSFTYELFVERYNADLANGLGNLLSRTSTIVKKNLDGVVPSPGEATPGEQAIADRAREAAAAYPGHFENRRFHLAVEGVRELLAATDKYINDAEPWRLAREPESAAALGRVLYTGLETVRIAALLLSPIMPSTGGRILAYLGETRARDGHVPFAELAAWGGLKPGHRLGEVPMTFPRIDGKKLEAVQKQAGIEADKARQAAASPKDGKAPRAVAPVRPEIAFTDFEKVDLRVGVVREASLVEGADKLVRLMVDLGEGRLRQIFAGIRRAYPDPVSLVGRQVVVVANLKPRQMKFGLSEGMVLAGVGSDKLAIATFARPIEPGDPVS